VIILTAEKSASATAADYMPVKRTGEADLACTGDGHCGSDRSLWCKGRVGWVSCQSWS